MTFSRGVGESVFGDEREDLLRDLSLVKDVVSGLERFPAASSSLPGFRLHELCKHLGKVLLDIDLPHGRNASVGKIGPGRARPHLQELLFAPLEGGRKPFEHGESLLRQVHGGRKDLCKSHGPEAGQGCDPGRDGVGHGGGQQSIAGNGIDPVFPEPLDGRPLRGGSLAGEAHYPFLVRQVDQDGHFAADAVNVGFQDGQGEPHRHTGVHGITTLLENVQSDPAGKIMPGGDHSMRAHDDGAGSEPSRVRTGENAEHISGVSGHHAPPLDVAGHGFP